MLAFATHQRLLQLIVCPPKPPDAAKPVAGAGGYNGSEGGQLQMDP